MSPASQKPTDSDQGAQSPNRRTKQQKQRKRIPASGFVPTALTAANDHPSIAAAIRKFVFDTMQKGVPGLKREFAAIRAIQDQNPKVPIYTSNASKFRYKDVYCTEKSRVVLTFLPSYGDFIHANWFRSELMDNVFIATQGPLEHTSGDFWRMIFQERILHIFMLCRCDELGKHKCHQYWPKIPGDTLVFYGVITIRNEGVNDHDPDVWTTNLTLTYNGETRKIEHRQWQTWPDKSVPRNPVPAFKLLHIARTSNFPVCVHCSAGIGRTGTLIGLELLQRNFMHAIEPSITQIVSEIRSQRTQAVQTEDQFIWICFVMLGKLCYHGLMASQEYKIFHAQYETYIRHMGGQPPIHPMYPKEMPTIKLSRENVTQPPAIAAQRRRSRTQRFRTQKSDSDEKNGLITLGPTTPQASTPIPSSSSADVKQQVGGSRRRGGSAPNNNNREPRSLRQTRKGKEKKNPTDETHVPAVVIGKVAAEDPRIRHNKNYQSLPRPSMKQQQPPATPIIAAAAKMDDNDNDDQIASERQIRASDKPMRSERPNEINEDGGICSASAELLRKKSEDEKVKSVFLQPNLARDEKKEFFASSKPIPNGPAPPKPENSYYADASENAKKLGGTPFNLNDDNYFAPPKKQ